MNRRILGGPLLAVFVLSACDTTPGVVTSTYDTGRIGWTEYRITVRRDQTGHLATEYVDKETFDKCRRGTRWPECAR